MNHSIENIVQQDNNNIVEEVNHVQKETLKRKNVWVIEIPAKIFKEDIEDPCSSNAYPTKEIMGIYVPMKPDYSRLPKGFSLGKLAHEKYAGIVYCELYDRYEIQIYCRLFEHFSYYPIYLFDQDIWIPAHVHAYAEVLKFRTPPSVLMAEARSRPTVN
ncbi:hypothetical protein GCK72_023431 [Caenorhabditis remanei]|uniref:Uncharacterized protein n=1 Tax=Caenorhabditis remanei TaxID=31234 RepID=E3MMK5_CAERE|nr:hypothetical protein GCK72_023431 [Caenorhabditis remanei]EFP05011.1 hypothetical protein CRE_03250 [Caenorhabditis remanei]KAF1746973.1 hypothetical protein GCK72_023431 [Caenorhabditis remanei]